MAEKHKADLGEKRSFDLLPVDLPQEYLAKLYTTLGHLSISHFSIRNANDAYTRSGHLAMCSHYLCE